MIELHQARRAAADQSLAEYEFGEDDTVSEAGRWDSDGDEWTCILSMDGIEGPYQCGFIVRFQSGTAEVDEAYPGDPH